MKKPTIHSVQVPFENWKLYQENDSIKIWTNTFGDILSLNFFYENPNLPEFVADIHSLRNFYRDVISESHGSIVEVEKEFLGDFVLIKSIFKISQEITGFIFLASYSLIMESYTFIIKVECPEKGTTGLRESTVLMMCGIDGSIPKGSMEGWFYDPYDPALNDKVSTNISDQEKYDRFFPNHPLTRARATLNQIKKKIIFGDEISLIDQFFKDL